MTTSRVRAFHLSLLAALTAPTHPSSNARWLTIAIASLLLLAMALRLAWLGDDGFITLRSVENWVTGNGMRWNSDERVQTFTHPLWMLLLSLGRVLLGEAYFATLWLSLTVSMGAIALLLWRAATLPAIVATTALLLAARAFGDYMTSGLETPLTYLLLIVFVGIVRAPEHGRQQATRRYTRAVLLTALLATNRMDLGLLCIVPVLGTMRGVPLRAVVYRGALASLPLLCWLVFATIYYGSPFPVTAHAKAFDVGIPAMDLAQQGLRYLWHSVVHDPALIATVAIGGFALLASKRQRWLAAGSLLYVLYIVKVGGDFMQGRFLLPPFVVVVVCLNDWLQQHGWRAAAPVSIVALTLTFATGLPAWLTTPSEDAPPSDAMVAAQHGIIDERKAYYRDHGLFAEQRKLPRFG